MILDGLGRFVKLPGCPGCHEICCSEISAKRQTGPARHPFHLRSGSALGIKLRDLCYVFNTLELQQLKLTFVQ